MIDNFRKLLNEEQDPATVEKVIDRLKGLLMNGEEIIYIAVQKKPAVNFSPDCVALTNKRIIFCRPKNFGLSMEFQDHIWKDIYDCHLKENLLGAEFTVQTVNSLPNKMDFLPKNQARKLYSLAQEQEEIQKEYRRQRDLEEVRATAGNINVTANVPPPAPVDNLQPHADDPLETLKKLKTLFENQLITEAEYNTKKTEVLARM